MIVCSACAELLGYEESRCGYCEVMMVSSGVMGYVVVTTGSSKRVTLV